MTEVVISGTGLFTPSESITNQELVASFNEYATTYNQTFSDDITQGKKEALAESSEEFIVKASGIKSRYVMNKTGILDTDTMHPRLSERVDAEQSIQCEMSLQAAKDALAHAQKAPDSLDAVIVACSNLQRPYPAVAVEVQSALGIDGFAFDMNVACSSATFGLQMAMDTIAQGHADSVLVVNPEICSGHLNFRDRNSHFIFGDACTAIIVEREDQCARSEVFKILGTRLKTKFSNNIRNNFGFLNRAEPNGHEEKLFVQNGHNVFKEVTPIVSKLIKEHLDDLQIEPTSLTRFWLHQANLKMNQLIIKKVLGRDASEDEAPIVLDEYANTSSAGSIIAFHKHQTNFPLNGIGTICSFGAGYSVGNVVVQKVQL